MKKIVKLTESELRQIIEKTILKEGAMQVKYHILYYKGYDIRLAEKDNSGYYFPSVYLNGEYKMGLRGILPKDRAIKETKWWVDKTLERINNN